MPTKVRPAKDMVFLIVMYGYESWTIKKAERQRIDAFELWCWGRLMRASWMARKEDERGTEETEEKSGVQFSVEQVCPRVK